MNDSVWFDMKSYGFDLILGMFSVDTQFHAPTLRAKSDLALAMQVCKGVAAAPKALILGCTVSAGRGWKQMHTALVNSLLHC